MMLWSNCFWLHCTIAATPTWATRLHWAQYQTAGTVIQALCSFSQPSTVPREQSKLRQISAIRLDDSKLSYIRFIGLYSTRCGYFFQNPSSKYSRGSTGYFDGPFLTREQLLFGAGFSLWANTSDIVSKKNGCNLNFWPTYSTFLSERNYA